MQKSAVTSTEPDYIRALMDLTLNHNVGSTLLGGVAGLSSEALRGHIASKEEREDKDQRPATPWSLLRSGLVGGGLGFTAARAFPVQSSKLNRALLENAFLKPVGRVASNLTDHFGYIRRVFRTSGAAAQPRNKLEEVVSLLQDRPLQVLKSVVKDQPLEAPDSPAAAERREAVRHIFSLPANYSLFDENPNGTYALKGHTKNMLQKSLEAALKKDPTPTPKKIYDSVLGNVTLIPQEGGQSYKYRDRWDFDLGANERVDTTTNFLRHFVSRLTKPMVFEGTLEAPKL